MLVMMVYHDSGGGPQWSIVLRKMRNQGEHMCDDFLGFEV